MPSYKLIYFPARGRAEAVRLAFAYGGIDFEDVRMAGADIPGYKATAPFGQFPYLLVDGAPLAQSAAMLRMVAKKAGLYPADELQAAVAESVADQLNDVLNVIVSIVYTGGFSPEEQKTKLAEFKEGKLVAMAEGICKIIAANGGKFVLGGEEPSFVDLAIFAVAESSPRFGLDMAEAVPAFKPLIDAVAANPKLTAYFKRREEVEAAEAAAAATAAAK